MKLKAFFKKIVIGLLALPFQVNATPIHPQEAENLKSYEFGELVKLFMQDDNSESDNINWDFNSENPDFVWITDGVENMELNESTIFYRTAIIRMNILGVYPEILGKRKKELAWEIDYRAPSDTRFGVNSISITPYKFACFGNLGSNCILEPFKSLEASNISYQKICRDNLSAASFTESYKLTVKDKKPIYLEYIYSSGSGGEGTFFELKFESKELCD